MTSLQELAQEIKDCLPNVGRGIDTDAPQWIKDILYTAVEQVYYDQWSFDVFYCFICDLAAGNRELNYNFDTGLEGDTSFYDCVDWLKSAIDRKELIEEVAELYGMPKPFDIITTIQNGQIEEKRRILYSLISSLEEKIKELEELEEDEDEEEIKD